VIVRRAAESARSVGELCAAIAEAIPDPADRASFLAAAPLENPAGAPAPPARERRDAPPAAAALTPAELGEAERRLAQYIGPLAAVLVKKAARAAGDRDDFYARLGASIANPADRAAFLAAVPA
jgi:serine/threonine-protein kinase